MSIDLSLDRLRLLITHLPPYTRPTIHIAGTNGKGSISALITSILTHSDSKIRVGRFNSPHLVSVHDCITLDGQAVDKRVYTTAWGEVEKVDKEHVTNLSSFELLTLTALRVFEEAQADVVVLEVGMGGRLDATNIVDDETILVSAISAVDLDHQAFLGNTVAQIAREKAGIARKGKILVLGRQLHQEVEPVVQDVVAGVGGSLEYSLAVTTREWDQSIDGPPPPAFSLFQYSPEFIKPCPLPVRISMPCFPDPIYALLPLHGDHQLDNLGTALAVINVLLTQYPITFSTRITPISIARGINSVSWPGRLSFHAAPVSQSRPLTVLVDGAHNPASAATLHTYIQHLISLSSNPPSSSRPTHHRRKIHLTYLIALSHSPPKTPSQTLSALLPPIVPPNSEIELNTSVITMRFTPPDGMPWVKSVPPSEVAEVARTLLPNSQVKVVEGLGEGEGVEEALGWVTGEAERRSLETKKGDAQSFGAEEQGELVVLAGSLYLVADFYRLLGAGS